MTQWPISSRSPSSARITLALVVTSLGTGQQPEGVDRVRQDQSRQAHLWRRAPTSSRMSAELLKPWPESTCCTCPIRAIRRPSQTCSAVRFRLFFGDVSTSLPPVRAGKLKGLAVSACKRSPLAPDLPTIDEAGLKGYELTAWFGAYTPAKTPKPIVDKLNAGVPRRAGRQGGRRTDCSPPESSRRQARRTNSKTSRPPRPRNGRRSWPTPALNPNEVSNLVV